MLRESMRRTAPALISAAIAACAPVLAHGPRVEPGLFVGGTAGLLLTRDTALSPHVVTPQWVPYVRYGRAGKPGGVAGSLALAWGGSPESPVEADAYVQLPSGDSKWAYGAGVVASPALTMPYAQVGKSLSRGYEVYTTQAFVRRRDFNERQIVLIDAAPTEVRPRYWSPTLALRRRTGRWGGSLQVTGAFGRYDERQRDPGGPPGETRTRPLRAVTTSVTWDTDVACYLREVLGVTRRPIPRDTLPG
jgi:hypothetical protein